MFPIKVGTVQSSSSVADVAWGAVWLSLATITAAATATLISGDAGGVSQVVAQPLSKLSQVLSRGDDGRVSRQPCTTLTSVHGNPSC